LEDALHALAGGPAEGIELLDPLDVGARAALAVSRGERPLPGQDVMTLQRYAESMNVETKRATVYFDSDLHRALRFKAAETQRSVSELVNRAVRRALAEDADDLAAFDERRNEPSLSFEEVVQDLKRRGKL